MESSNDFLMELYKKYLVPEKILFLENFEHYGSLYFKGIFKGHMNLCESDSPKQQVLTMGHEVCHYHPDFIEYTRRVQRGMPPNRVVDGQITALARKIFRERKDIANFVKEAYTKAKARNKELPF